MWRDDVISPENAGEDPVSRLMAARSRGNSSHVVSNIIYLADTLGPSPMQPLLVDLVHELGLLLQVLPRRNVGVLVESRVGICNSWRFDRRRVAKRVGQPQRGVDVGVPRKGPFGSRTITLKACWEVVRRGA